MSGRNLFAAYWSVPNAPGVWQCIIVQVPERLPDTQSTSLQSSHALECLYCEQMYQMHKAPPASADSIKPTMITILSYRLALQSDVNMLQHLQPG